MLFNVIKWFLLNSRYMYCVNGYVCIIRISQRFAKKKIPCEKKIKTLCSTVNGNVFAKFPTHKYIVKRKS